MSISTQFVCTKTALIGGTTTVNMPELDTLIVRAVAPLQVPSLPMTAPLSVKPDVLDKSVPLNVLSVAVVALVLLRLIVV